MKKIKITLIALAAALSLPLVGCQSTAFIPAVEGDVDQIHIVDDSGQISQSYTPRPGSVGFSFFRNELTFVDQATGERHVVKDGSWKITRR